MADVVTIVWNESAYNRAFHDWDGMTGRYIGNRAERLASLARTTAGVRTGALVSRIGVRRSHRGRALEAKVGVNVNMPDTARSRGYGWFHHEGTLPHVISARGKALRFVAGGSVLYRKSVHHPGTKPNDYLTGHLREVIR
ncbi:putative major tail protein [Gordonia phage GMA2]|uniref:Putative major tail protein n=1 Tax=Gordonia phage GMA2 TaxID=1647283 RepID=A0A0K0N735_9CAUD|nr:putative major tail protein [Gordonia phage GMA2]AKJ72563.1 putative major tail protein [Gordonia phage GMA2]